eukprot:scaffold8477_cov112-Isochrysis_galbana.AAC.8
MGAAGGTPITHRPRLDLQVGRVGVRTNYLETITRLVPFADRKRHQARAVARPEVAAAGCDASRPRLALVQLDEASRLEALAGSCARVERIWRAIQEGHRRLLRLTDGGRGGEQAHGCGAYRHHRAAHATHCQQQHRRA